MRYFFTAFLLFSLGGIAAAQFGPGDRPDVHRGDEKAAWQAWLKELGSGPVYRVEVLFRWSEDGRLYYLRTLVSAKQPTGRMSGLALGENDKPIPPPPDPKFARRRAELTWSSKGVAPPLAETTRLYGASLHPEFSGPGRLEISEWDTAAGMDLPKNAGATEVGFHHGIFVAELLSPEKLVQEQPLRQDATYYRRRTKELTHLLLTTHRGELLKNDHTLAYGIHVTRDAKLLDEAHRRLEPWIDQPAKGVKFPRRLASAVLANGQEGDIALSERLLQKNPHLTYSFTGEILYLAKRTNGARVMPVWRTLVRDRQVGDEGDFVRQIRKLTPMVPAPIRGDNVLISFVRAFALRATDFHLAMAQDALLAKGERANLTAEEKQLCQLAQRNPSMAQYFFATEGDRKRGQEAALKWLESYRAR